VLIIIPNSKDSLFEDAKNEGVLRSALRPIHLNDSPGRRSVSDNGHLVHLGAALECNPKLEP
jgi:hypothetical protein